MKSMKKEIGSEFWSVPIKQNSNNEFYPDKIQWFLSGRSALRCIIEEIKDKGIIKKAALPSWCCESIIKPFIDADIPVEFYPIYFKEKCLKYDLSHVEECDIVLVLDYFGFSAFGNIEGLENHHIIRDVTHSIFSKKYDDAHYYFGSLRKWAGFYTGGFGWGHEHVQLPDNSKYVSLRADAMKKKEMYISGEINSKAYLDIFNEAEELLDDIDCAGSCETDVLRAKKIDIQQIKKKRRNNVKVLFEELGDMAVFTSMDEEDCPLFFPIIVPNKKRDELRGFLIENNIYCPIHWPLSSYHDLNTIDESLYYGGLSLLCDQRYDAIDMERQIDVIKRFWRG